MMAYINGDAAKKGREMTLSQNVLNRLREEAWAALGDPTVDEQSKDTVYRRFLLQHGAICCGPSLHIVEAPCDVEPPRSE